MHDRWLCDAITSRHAWRVDIQPLALPPAAPTPPLAPRPHALPPCPARRARARRQPPLLPRPRGCPPQAVRGTFSFGALPPVGATTGAALASRVPRTKRTTRGSTKQPSTQTESPTLAPTAARGGPPPAAGRRPAQRHHWHALPLPAARPQPSRSCR